MGILDVGAGAAQGLDSFLLQMLRESQLEDEKKRTAEGVRSNQAREQISRDTLTENSRLREATQRTNDLKEQELVNERLRQEANRTRDDMRAGLDDLIPGAVVSGDTRNKAVTTGAALPERFNPAFDEMFQGPLPSDVGLPGAKRNDYILAGQAKNQPAGVIEQKTYVVDGKTIDGFLNNRTGRITDKAGNDITDKTEHYTAPDRTLIQTDGGYMRRPDAAAALAGGKDVPLPTTGSTRTMQEGAQMLRPHVTELKSLAAQLDQKGLFGPVMSRVRAAMEHLGTSGDDAKDMEALGKAIADDPELNKDELVGQFATTLGLMTSGMGRVHGGARGGGSIQMINYLKSLLSANSSLSMFNGRANAVDSFLKTYAEGPGGAEKAPAEDPNDLYGQYLKRTQGKK